MSGSDASMCALRARSSGPAVCSAAANAAERMRHRPASTQLTGIGVSDVAMGFRLVTLGYLEALPVDLQAELDRWRGV